MGRVKFDVTVQEADVRRILIENDLPPECASELPFKLVFQLLDSTAQAWSKVTLARHLKADGQGAESTQALADAETAKNDRARVLAQIRHHLGLPEPESASAHQT